MVKCANCEKNLFLKKKYYHYSGKKKGSFQVSDEQILCKSCFSNKISLREDSPNDLAELGGYMIENKYKLALKQIEKLADKKKPPFWYSKGNILRNLNEDKKALECYEEAIYLDTHYVKAWYRRGQTLFELKKYSSAEKCFRNVLQLENAFCEALKIEEPNKHVGSKEWGLAALFMYALCLLNQKKHKDSDYVFTIFYHLVKNISPFNSVHSEKFIAFCTSNAGEILDAIEPSHVMEITTAGKRH